MLHGIALDELVVIVNLNLIQGVKSLIVTLIVASANKVKLLGVWVLNTLEIMRKTTIVVRLHLDRLNCFVSNVQLVHIL